MDEMPFCTIPSGDMSQLDIHNLPRRGVRIVIREGERSVAVKLSSAQAAMLTSAIRNMPWIDEADRGVDRADVGTVVVVEEASR